MEREKREKDRVTKIKEINDKIMKERQRYRQTERQTEIQTERQTE